MACGGPNKALYHGEVQLTFEVPNGVDENGYLEQIVKMMVSHGWMDGPVEGDGSPGTLLRTNEVRATMIGGDAVNRGLGRIRLSGECRNTNDHRDDSAGVDITDQLTQR